MHAIAARVGALTRIKGQEIVLDDSAVDRLAKSFEEAVRAGEAFEAVDALLAVAMVLLETGANVDTDGGDTDDGAVDPNGVSGRPAARTLLAFVLAIQPGLVHLDQARAAAVGDKARVLDDAARSFSTFKGEAGQSGVLGGQGPRPAGTTAASPLARFALLGQTPKRGGDQTSPSSRKGPES